MKTALSIIGILFLTASLARADSIGISTSSDFQKGDLLNGTTTQINDGEVAQNCHFEPLALTLTGRSLPKALYNHAACLFGDTIVVVGGADIMTSYSANVYLATAVNDTLTEWQSGPSLPLAVCNHRVLRLNQFVYCFGGRTAQGLNTTIWRSEIDFSTHTLGAWQAIGTMPAPMENCAAVAAGGRIYLLGGTNGLPIKKVYMTDMAPNGSIISWQETTELPQAVCDLEAVVYKDPIWVVGGNNGSASTERIYSAAIQADGTITAWTRKADSPSPISRHGLVATSIGLMVFGGAASAAVNCSIMKNSNDLGLWTTYLLPEEIEDHAALVADTTVYILGGKNAGGPVATVRRLPLAEYQPWKKTANIPGVVSAAAGTAKVRNFYYMSGGQTSGQCYNTIYKSTDAPSGGFNTWEIGGYLPVSLSSHALVAFDDRLYCLGGNTVPGASVRTVYYSDPINPITGDIGGWALTNPIPGAMTLFQMRAATSSAGYVYASFYQSTQIYYAKIQSDGTLGSWTPTASLPQIRANLDIVCHNGYLYAFLGTSPIRCQYAKLQTDGSIANWNDAAFFPPEAICSGSGPAWILDDGVAYLMLTDTFHRTLRGKIEADGSIASWDILDDALATTQFAKGSGHDGVVKVFDCQGVDSEYYWPIHYSASWVRTIDLSTTRWINSIQTNHTFPPGTQG